MPLASGSSKATMAKNFDELRHGKTYARTQRRYGKTKARKQMVAIALKEARKNY